MYGGHSTHIKVREQCGAPVFSGMKLNNEAWQQVPLPARQLTSPGQTYCGSPAFLHQLLTVEPRVVSKVSSAAQLAPDRGARGELAMPPSSL